MKKITALIASALLLASLSQAAPAMPPEQVKQISRVADGVIVGSAVIKVIENNLGRADLVPQVRKFIRRLRQAI